jgi:predicted nucleotidyltransferase
MQVDPNASLAGYPVLLIRQALRKLRHIDIWSSDLLEAAAGLPTGAGRELASALAGLGLIQPLQKHGWTITPAGMTFTAATAAKRLKRATAERALAAFLERVARVNTDPYFLGRVARVVLFGSMLNPDTARPSDIDLAVEIVPKITDWDTSIEKNNDRAQELLLLGHRFGHSIEYAVCWQLEIFRFLKGRSRTLSLADYNIEKRLVLAVPHRMLLGDDEPAVPVLGDDAPVPRLRRRSQDCPF